MTVHEFPTTNKRMSARLRAFVTVFVDGCLTDEEIKIVEGSL